MAQVTTGVPWTVDRRGRELRQGDRVAFRPNGSKLAVYPATIRRFDPDYIDTATAKVEPGRWAVVVDVDGDTTAGDWWARGIDCEWVRSAPRGAGLLDPCPVFNLSSLVAGDAVGVLDSGPCELQGRVGEVASLAYHVDPRVGDVNYDPVAIEVITDGGHQAWCQPGDVVPCPTTHADGHRSGYTGVVE